MECVKVVKIASIMSLYAARPRAGTISRWHNSGDRLKCLVEGTPIGKSWDNLTPEQQEVVCTEYLRNHDLEDCPKLEYLLLPIGRTLKEVDIYGFSTDKREIFAQVTHYNKDHPECRWKIEALKRYGEKDAYLIFFCNCKDVAKENGILFIPTTKVFKWLEGNEMYLEKLFTTS